jgi:hypothetical protein
LFNFGQEQTLRKQEAVAQRHRQDESEREAPRQPKAENRWCRLDRKIWPMVDSQVCELQPTVQCFLLPHWIG